MTNRDKLKTMTTEELRELFCGMMEDIHEKADVDSCNLCPVAKFCRRGHNGFIAWLDKEAKECG